MLIYEKDIELMIRELNLSLQLYISFIRAVPAMGVIIAGGPFWVPFWASKKVQSIILKYIKFKSLLDH